jgi:hypothetical protein
MLYAQGSSSVVRHAAEVISDVNAVAQAARQMSTRSVVSFDSARPDPTPRVGTPASPAPQTLMQSGWVPFDRAASQHLGTSAHSTSLRTGSPIAGSFITTLQRPTQQHPILAAHSPASLSYMSGFAPSDAPTVAGSVVGSYASGRLSFTENVDNIVASGILDAVAAAPFREPHATVMHAASQAPSVSAASDWNSAYAARTSFERVPSSPGAGASACFLLSCAHVRVLLIPTRSLM